MDGNCDGSVIVDMGAYETNLLGKPCDGLDANLCKEGVYECNGAELICTDLTGDDIEICDGLDNDCDGELPQDESDADNDGFMICENDCDDSDITVSPGAVEKCGTASCSDGKDNDCDGYADASDTDCGGWCPAAGQSSSIGTADNIRFFSFVIVFMVPILIIMSLFKIRLEKSTCRSKKTENR